MQPTASRSTHVTPHSPPLAVPMKELLLILAVVISHSSRIVQASAGDRDPHFQRCVADCEATGCISPSRSVQTDRQCSAACPQRSGQPVPLILRAFHWTCTDDCRYLCMMAIEHRRTTGHQVKYYGKWPFRRVLGMQEVLSVLFSLANMAVHMHRLRNLKAAWQSDAAVSRPAHRLYWSLWMLYAICAANSWLWSAVFHSRDTYTTERFDYLSADLTVFAGLLVSMVCTVGRLNITALFMCAVPVMMPLVSLGYYMLCVKFDYGLNVLVCIVFGVVQQLLWCMWAVYKRHPGTKQLLTFVVIINAALSLEVFDFPPIAALLDAHAMWHLCTIPLTYLWYQFVFCDAAWRLQTTIKQQSAVKAH